MEIIEIIRIGSNISVALPLLLSLVFIKKSPASFLFITLISIVAAIADFVSYTHLIDQRYSYILYNGQDFLQFILFSFYYYRILFEFNRKYQLIAGSLIYFISILAVSLFQGFHQYQGIAWAIGGLIIISYAVSHYNYLMAKPHRADSNLTSYLYINGSIIVYFALSLGFLLLANFILNTLNPTEAKVLWTLHNANNILRNIGVTIAFLYLGRYTGEVLSAEQIAYYETVLKKRQSS